MDDTNTPEQMDMATKPLPEHEWLKKLLGDWKIETEMAMPDGQKMKSEGTANTTSLGGLWALSESTESMPGLTMHGYFGLGYDVSYKEYRAFMVMSASSHLWQYTGELSADGKTMTLTGDGPSMTSDETVQYREVLEWVDDDHFTRTSSGPDESGEMQEFAKATYTRA